MRFSLKIEKYHKPDEDNSKQCAPAERIKAMQAKRYALENLGFVVQVFTGTVRTMVLPRILDVSSPMTISNSLNGDFHAWNADFRLNGIVISMYRTGAGFHPGILN